MQLVLGQIRSLKCHQIGLKLNGWLVEWHYSELPGLGFVVCDGTLRVLVHIMGFNHH